MSLRLDSAIEMTAKKDQEMEPETVTLMGQTFEEVPATLAAVLNALMATGVIPTTAPAPEPSTEPSTEPSAEPSSEPSTSDSVPVTLKSDSDKEKDMDKKEREAFQAKLDAANEKVAKLEKDQEKLPDSVRADISFEVNAASVLGEKPETFSGKPRREIMETVLSKKLDSADFKEKSDEYVQVRYDILLEEIDQSENTEPLAQLREASTRPVSHKDLEDIHAETLKNWQARGSEPLLVSKAGA